jgi:phosphoglycolate phosphatase
MMLMRFDTVLFDLDGTLTDPAIGITNSIIYSLDKFGISVNDRSELYFFIGPPLINSFMQYCNFSKTKAETAVEYYREYFKDKGLFENSVYSGIPELLETLKKSGVKIVLATSKPLIFAEKILKHFDLYKYFDLSVGATLDGTLGEKTDIIAKALTKLNHTSLSNIAMVGDRKFDIEGAIQNSITPIGVLYGYGDEDELKTAGAKLIAKDVNELKNILI